MEQGQNFRNGRNQENLSIYFGDLSEYPPMTLEEERSLYPLISAGDVQAKERIVGSHLRLAVDVATDYQNLDVPLADLISAANEGLLVAADRFDSSVGAKFSVYAVWWMRKEILKSFGNERVVRIPSRDFDIVFAVNKIQRDYEKSWGTALNPGNPKDLDYIASQLDRSPESILKAIRRTESAKSLEDPIGYGDGGTELTFGDSLPSDNDAPDSETHNHFLNQDLERALKSLPERDARILTIYFGLDGEESKTLEQIGNELDLTKERVRQLKDRALAKMKENLNGNTLGDYL